ncbi:MAG: hypothetical protein WCI20_09730 [bacterium]
MNRGLNICMIAVASLTTVSMGAEPGRSWVMTNPTGRLYSNELVRLRVDVPKDFDPAGWTVTEDGRDVSCQTETIDGKPEVWVLTNLGPGEKHTYAIKKRASAKFQGKVAVRRESDTWVMDNGRTAVQVPAQAEPGQMPPPVLAIRLPGDRWLGKGQWKTDRKRISFDSKVVGDGTLFGKIRLEYRFEGVSGVGKVPAFYRADVSLSPGQNHVVIEESYAMSRESYWEFDSAAGWGARNAFAIPHFGGFDREDMKDTEGKPYPFPPQSLKTGQTRMGDTLLNLVPRWSQAYDDGWFFMAHDGKDGVGAMVCRAGKWLWPYDSMIEIKVKSAADYAGFRCPTWRGARVWFLLAGPFENWADHPRCEEYVLRHSFESLDKLHQEYILDWPGLKPPVDKDGKPVVSSEEYGSGVGRFGRRSRPFFGWGPAVGKISGDDHPITALIRAQVLLDPDTFGDYWRYYSPENPNFATSWWAPIFPEVAKCAGHPQYPQLVQLAKMKLMEDLYHSVTLPGGAGQECPGYMSYAVDHLRRNIAFCKENLGFDLTDDPRLKAAPSFLLHLSQPNGDGSRRSHPGGDTHPPGPDIFPYARNFGVTEDPATFVTEELPGFGVVFRNHPSTPRETYFAFKSGPNRGHYHGDQLSFHYGAFGRMLLVDHHCSYKPRAGQEHMHNRVAFHTEKIPWANMDGYERVIGFKTSPEVDMAVGQVESERLRATEQFPPEKWDNRFPEQGFDVPLKYRRTVVLVKSADKGGPLQAIPDYFVIRDQYIGPDVFATYCLHGYGDKCEQREKTFDFDGLRAFVAAPKDFDVSRHDWQHANGEPESTKGLRLTTRGRSGEFITVLMPRPMPAVETIELILKDGYVKTEAVKNGAPKEVKMDLCVGLRSQGGKPVAEPPRVRISALQAIGCEERPTITESADGWKIQIKASFSGSRGMQAGKGAYELEIRKDGAGYKGAFKGAYTPEGKAGPGKPQDVSGAVIGNLSASGYPLKLEYNGEPLPAMSVIPGGVKVGEDEVVFGGGVEEKDDVVYVAVRRSGKDVATLRGRDIDLNRSQGEIGLFVPDAGYPFGTIPDWLIRQRAGKPDWYRNLWPLTGGQE